MKNFLRILLFALCGFAGTTFADDFKSLTIPLTVMPMHIARVHGDQFMVIRNFTQEEGGNMRGVVQVTKLPGIDTANVLAAAIISQSASPPLEVINSVVIAGPADVSVTCGATTTGHCFICYKKDDN